MLVWVCPCIRLAHPVGWYALMLGVAWFECMCVHTLSGERAVMFFKGKAPHCTFLPIKVTSCVSPLHSLNAALQLAGQRGHCKQSLLPYTIILHHSLHPQYTYALHHHSLHPTHYTITYYTIHLTPSLTTPCTLHHHSLHNTPYTITHYTLHITPSLITQYTSHHHSLHHSYCHIFPHFILSPPLILRSCHNPPSCMQLQRLFKASSWIRGYSDTSRDTSAGTPPASWTSGRHW